MQSSKFDALCIGNAIFDILAHVDDDFLARENLVKGSMRLIEQDEADRLYDHMGQAVRISGGSAGNTAAGIASFGGNAAFIGKVADDEIGKAYTHDMKSIGVHYGTQPLVDGAASGRSMICITPDGERTMNTYLGACQELTVDDIDPSVVSASRITYLEGYLWDPPKAKEAFRKAAEIAHHGGGRVAITLSDSFCVDRYRAEFLDLMRSGTVDIVFSNTHELHSLYETSDFDTAVAAIRDDVGLAIVTRSEKGSMVVAGDETVTVDASPVENITDLTGAGDLYASGFLYGLAREMPYAVCAELGGLAAAEVISHIGARPEKVLKNLAIDSGLAVEA